MPFAKMQSTHKNLTLRVLIKEKKICLQEKDKQIKMEDLNLTIIQKDRDQKELFLSMPLNSQPSTKIIKFQPANIP